MFFFNKPSQNLLLARAMEDKDLGKMAEILSKGVDFDDFRFAADDKNLAPGREVYHPLQWAKQCQLPAAAFQMLIAAGAGEAPLVALHYERQAQRGGEDAIEAQAIVNVIGRRAVRERENTRTIGMPTRAYPSALLALAQAIRDKDIERMKSAITRDMDWAGGQVDVPLTDTYGNRKISQVRGILRFAQMCELPVEGFQLLAQAGVPADPMVHSHYQRQPGVEAQQIAAAINPVTLEEASVAKIRATRRMR